jgi:3-hydroxybutyrate dehydrogenase
MNDLTGRTALVTGGASGIGAACARELAGRGATVTVADVDEGGAKTLADEIGGNAWAVDLLDVSALEELRLETDVLVNNAGVQSIDPIVDFSPERFRSMLALMVEAPFLLIRAALPHMIGQRFGRVVNI